MENNLKLIRKRKGLTLQELGDMSGMAKSQMHSLEQQIGCTPLLETAYSIANSLKVSVFEIWPNNK